MSKVDFVGWIGVILLLFAYALNKVAVLHDFLHSKDDYQDSDFYNPELLKFVMPKN